jgi:hypothetical protein
MNISYADWHMTDIFGRIPKEEPNSFKKRKKNAITVMAGKLLEMTEK